MTLKINNLVGFAKGGASFDLDAQAYFTATGITNPTIQNAANSLALAIKAISDGDVWTNKLKLIYLAVLGDQVMNLRNPATFQGTVVPTVTQDANGYTSDNVGGYIDTGFNQSTDGAEDDEHLSVYSRTDNTDSGYAIGAFEGGGVDGSGFSLRNSGNFVSRCQDNDGHNLANTDSRGYFSINRTASTGYRKRVNATNTDVTQASDAAPRNLTFFIMTRNISGVATGIDGRTFGWFAIGRGLTEAEDGELRTAVEAFQDALGRGVIE